MILFGNAKKIVKVLQDAMGTDHSLRKNIRVLKDELEDLKTTKKLELKENKMQKMARFLHLSRYED